MSQANPNVEAVFQKDGVPIARIVREAEKYYIQTRDDHRNWSDWRGSGPLDTFEDALLKIVTFTPPAKSARA